MSYNDLINDNVSNYGNRARYAYHYTDATNAASILSEGFIYSRQEAIKRKLMHNDNASSSVIGNTLDSSKDYVRFYFRPLTPTQFYNEGYKPLQIRYEHDANANVPMPIFFIFNLEEMLQDKNIFFSEVSRAGYSPGSLKQGLTDFQTLPFDKIYSDGSQTDREMVKYRHAELACRNKFPIDAYLAAIVCRTEAEKNTFLSYLPHDIYQKYKNKIQVEGNTLKLFERNGLFVETVNFEVFEENDSLNIPLLEFKFSNNFAKRDYVNRKNVHNIEPVNFKLVISENFRKNKEFTGQLDYLKPCANFENIPLSGYEKNYLTIRFFIEGCCMFNETYHLLRGEKS